MEDALPLVTEEGRAKLRKAPVSCKEAYPAVSEWGNPAGFIASHFQDLERGTRITETSKYPEEKKTKVILQVAASERGLAQTTQVGL